MINTRNLLRNGIMGCAALLGFGKAAFAALTVLTVPWVPANPTTPHTTYPSTSTTEATIILVATVPSAVGSTDSFTYQWNFGDGTSSTSAAVTNPYDISVTHQYPASAGTGTQWTAVVTVTDTTNSTTGSAKYYVIQEANTLPSRVNVAIDWGLSYMHRTMWRGSTTVASKTVQWGGWDSGCTSVNGSTYDCLGYGSINAHNVQAFEVSDHLASGPATDPYTDDVARGTARALNFLLSEAVAPIVYQYDPSKNSYICADGSIPQTTDSGACTGHGGQHQYNPTATSCTKPPCSVTYDGNKNGLMIYSNDGSGEYTYTTSPFLEMLIASGTPTAVAVTGSTGILGQAYQDIIQDILDFYGYSQYGYDYDASQGYTRGAGNSDQGGGWLYGPQQGDDNSTSQWAAIGFIAGERGASPSIPIPAAITDFNNVWITNGQDLQDKSPTGTDPYAVGDNLGAYGYRGSFYYSNAWGAFAVTPSGLVQMAMDGVGRTTNTVFGDSTTTFDQRWNNTETFYADNFCNTVASGAYYAPRAYMYGMFSFTKSMLEHDPGFGLAPIQYLRTLTPNVFTTNSSVPKNTIDWYAAVAPPNTDVNGKVGTDPCDGVAETLVSLQANPTSGSFDGHWFGDDYYSYQYYYETAWAIIMLNKTVTTQCVNNLVGAGASSNGSIPARIDLSWSNQANSTSYKVFRGTVSGGPYPTLVGTTTSTSISDTSGLTNGDTYFYVVDPINGTSEVCQSNQATVKVPVPSSGRH